MLSHCYLSTVRPLNPIAYPLVRCGMLLGIVAKSLKTVILLSQQPPTFLLFRDHRGVAQQCWIRLYSSSNIAGAMPSITHGLLGVYKVLWVVSFPKSNAGPKLLGVVASVCTPLPTQMQQLPTLLGCWELLRSIRRTWTLSKKLTQGIIARF